MRTRLLAVLLLAPLPFWAQVRPATGEGENPRPAAKRREVELPGVGMPATRSVSRTQPSTFAGFPEGETPSFSDYRLGAEDLISVYVMDAPEFSRVLRVDGNGTIRLPLVRTLNFVPTAVTVIMPALTTKGRTWSCCTSK